MNKLIAASLFLLLNTNVTINERSTLLPDPVAAILSQELSGEIAKEQLPEYGLTDARVEQFPTDGKIFYGTQKSRPPWDAEFAELWEMREANWGWTRHVRLASWDAMPVTAGARREDSTLR